MEAVMHDRKLNQTAGGAGLSPVAAALWPAVARQLRDAGVLDSVDTRSLATYCEVFAEWCVAGERVVKLLLEFGVKSGRLEQVRRTPTEKLSQAPTVTPAEIPTRATRSPNAIMRRVEVESETGLSRSTIYKRVKDGTFPAPLKLGERSVGWRVAEIEAFLASPSDYCARTGHVVKRV
ncbi:AlpA family phage regulatory protein [Paraburkholderia strydomiana]